MIFWKALPPFIKGGGGGHYDAVYEIRQNDLIPREQTNDGSRPTKLCPVDSFKIITFCHSSISLESSIGQATVIIGNVVTCILLFVTLKE